MTTTHRIGRRSMLEGISVGALGLAGAALLGCGGAKTPGDSAATGGGNAPTVTGATSGGGLPMTAPKVAGVPKRGGVWTTFGSGTDKQHDPHTALAGNVWHTIGEKGLEPDPVTAAIRPHVLTSWEVADPSGMTLVFKVHPKLFVHDMPPWNGRQFTAEDVAWNMMRIGGLFAERLKLPKTSFQRASMVANLVKAEAIDSLTVKVTLSKPNSAFFNGLLDTRVPFAPKEMDDVGWTDPMKLGGIGPFQVTEWVADQKTSFKRHPRYGEFRANEPYFDERRTVVVPDAAANLAAFVSGQIQTYAATTPDLVKTVRQAKPDANLYTWVDSNWQNLRPNVTFGAFRDLRVRRAIFLAIDYKGLGDGYYGVDSGWGYQAALCPGYPEAWKPDKVKTILGYNPDTKVEARAEAHKLLTAAGYSNGRGIDFDLLFRTEQAINTENATRFQGQMSTVFPEMKVTFKPVADTATFSIPLNAGQFHMISHTITSSPDAVIEFTSQYYTEGSRNYGRFSDKNFDALMDKATVELNRDARAKMLDEAQQRFIDEWMPIYVLYAQAVKTLVQANVGGYDTTAGTWFGYSGNTKVCRWYYVDK